MKLGIKFRKFSGTGYIIKKIVEQGIYFELKLMKQGVPGKVNSHIPVINVGMYPPPGGDWQNGPK